MSEFFGQNFENEDKKEKSEREVAVKEFKIEREKTEQENNAFEIIKRLRENGFDAYIAGGYARDLAMSQMHQTDFIPHDVDIAASAKKEEVAKIFSETLANEGEMTGKRFGVMRVKADEKYKDYIEVATFRKEKGSADGRRPEEVSFINSAAEDANKERFYDQWNVL